jgi:hypothetical protein
MCREIIGLKREETNGVWRMLHKEESIIYTVLNIVSEKVTLY